MRRQEGRGKTEIRGCGETSYPIRSKPIRRPETEKVIRMWQAGARAPSAANAATQSSENLKVNRQILFRILPNRLNQPTGLLKQLIGVVIHGGIAQKSAGRAFARLQPVGYG